MVQFSFSRDLGMLSDANSPPIPCAATRRCATHGPRACSSRRKAARRPGVRHRLGNHGNHGDVQLARGPKRWFTYFMCINKDDLNAHVCIFKYIYIYICAYVQLLYIYIYVCVCLYVLSMNTSIHMCIYIYVCVYVNICIYI